MAQNNPPPAPLTQPNFDALAAEILTRLTNIENFIQEISIRLNSLEGRVHSHDRSRTTPQKFQVDNCVFCLRLGYGARVGNRCECFGHCITADTSNSIGKDST